VAGSLGPGGSPSSHNKKADVLRHRFSLIYGVSYLVTVSEQSSPLHGQRICLSAQLYRDRADCENGFDEIKNQWGWGGYSTHDIERCALSARAVALIYNWWSWYVRLAHPKTRLEAITSRPKLLSAVGRMTSHGGQKKILLTITHEAATQIKALVANVRHGLQLITATAPQLTKPQRWFALVRYIVERILTCTPRPNLGMTALGTGN